MPQEAFHKRQPVLAGCLGCLALGLLLSCGFGVITAIGGKAVFDKGRDAAGIDSVFGTVGAAAEAGFGFSVNISDGATTFAMEPMEQRLVTCDDLQRVLFPHLSGTLETVTIESANYLEGPGGAITRVPLTCSWGGTPTKDTPLGTSLSGPPPGSLPASLDPPPGLPVADDDDSAR